MGLNATVTPGITVTSSTVLSAANLNLLGTPTVSITGSIDSSDIGADTVGESELINNSVTAAKIGDIGGHNFILSGDSSGNGTGLDTLAVDGSTNKISLLVNDTSALKARYITGHLDVSAATNSSDGDIKALNLTIKDNTITGDMLQSGALSRKVTINDIQPGGGTSGNGGVANISASGVTGGLIVFNPDAGTSNIGANPYYGTPEVLQPSGPDQYLKSTGTKGKLQFGALSGYPVAVVSAYSDAHIGYNDNPSSGTFTELYQSNIFAIQRVSRGVIRVFFNANVSSGDTIHALGAGISNHDELQMIPVVQSTAGVLQVDANGVLDTTNGENKSYVDVAFVNFINSSHTATNPQSAAASYLRNANFLNLHFYKS